MQVASGVSLYLRVSSASRNCAERKLVIHIFLALYLQSLDVSNPQLSCKTLTHRAPVAYGFLFGVYPSLVAATFGINGLSQNWGSMTLSPIVFGNIFNLLYGHIYDSHSYIHDGHRTCPEGLGCYRMAYWVTFGGSLLAVGISLWSIRHARVKQIKAERIESRDA